MTVFLAGCSPAPDDAAQEAPPSGAAFEHIHALAVDPDGGDLIVATHEGLYTLAIGSDGTASADGPIGGLDFDPMGFTLFGDSAYASGHPGPTTPNSYGRPNLGLIVSTDRGETWDNLSLTGQTDFHALTVASPKEGEITARVFGIDSSKPNIQRSLDGGATWMDGAELVARDILADPDDGTLYATTQQGLAVSSDDAASFSVDPQAPALYLIGADRSAGSLAGIDTRGAVWTQDSSGAWLRGGQVTGIPQAFTASGGRVFVADDRGIAFSDDNGESWVVTKVN